MGEYDRDLFGGKHIDAPLANIEGEAVILGILLNENHKIDLVIDILFTDDFHESIHASIYQAIIDATAVGRQASPITLRPVFENDQRFKEVGGAGYLAVLTSGIALSLISIKDQAIQIAELAARRRLIDSLEVAKASARDMSVSLAELVDESDAALVAAIEHREQVHSPSGHEAVREALDRINAIQQGESGLGCRVGITEFDELTGGLEAGQVVIIGARPGMGKTALMVSASLGLAKAGHGVAIFSLEMSAVELGTRMLSDLCCSPNRAIAFSNIMTGDVQGTEREVIRLAHASIKEWPLRIIDKGGLTISRLSILARRHKRRMAAEGNALRVIFVDYLQLLRPDKRGQSAYEATSEISRELKTLAKELGIAIVALAQLNREVEKRDDKRPQLADIRDSGQIEQDADIVMFLYREQYYLEKNEPKGEDKKAKWQSDLNFCRNRLDLLMPKRRNGPSGKRDCWYFANNQAVRGKDWVHGR